MTYEVAKTDDFPDGVINAYIEDASKKMTMLEVNWKQGLITNQGPTHDIQLFAIDIVIVDPYDDCYSVYLSYPGYYYQYDDTDFKDGNPNCPDYTKIYENIFTDLETQWFPGMSPDNSFFTFFEDEEVKATSQMFMGIETHSDKFKGVLEMFANIEVIKKLSGKIDMHNYVTYWVYTNR